MGANPRGVYVDHSVGGAIEVRAVASDGRTLVMVLVERAVYENRMAEGWRDWLNEVDPVLHLVRS